MSRRRPAPPPKETRAQGKARAAEDRRLVRGASVVIAYAYDMPPETLFRKTRGAAKEAEARQVMLAVQRRAAVLLRADSSIQRLGRGLGRDRTSVAHALHKIETACEGSPDVDVFVDHLAQIVAKLTLISGVVTSTAIADGIAAAERDDDAA